MSAQRLRPQAEGALRRAAARGVERDERMQQEGHGVARHVHVALVDFGGPRHRVEVFDLRAVGVVDDLSVQLVADSENLAERLALGKLDNGVIEFGRQMKSRTEHSFRARSGSVVTGGPTKAMRIDGLASLMALAKC